jgi:hypothetical protein
MARTASGKLRAFVLSLSLAAPLVLAPAVARAETEEAREEAKRLFARGSSAFLANRYAEALEDLRASYKLVPSPNSGLLIARCLRELNRRVEAVEMYTSVATDARKRAGEGDARYAQTADVAAREGAAVRATLGVLRVGIAHPPPGSRIEIDGATTLVIEGDVVVLHVPGEVLVRFRPKVGAEQSQRATITAGGDVRMEFTASAAEPAAPMGPPAAASPSRPSADDAPPAWTGPAAIAAGVVTLVGAGVFIGFGLRSGSTYDDLRTRCATVGCSNADQATADEGKRDQTIANVGLAAGIVGAVATVSFLLVRAYAPRSTAASGAPFGSYRANAW